jgi:hypothetical protein
MHLDQVQQADGYLSEVKSQIITQNLFNNYKGPVFILLRGLKNLFNNYKGPVFILLRGFCEQVPSYSETTSTRTSSHHQDEWRISSLYDLSPRWRTHIAAPAGLRPGRRGSSASTRTGPTRSAQWAWTTDSPPGPKSS